MTAGYPTLFCFSELNIYFGPACLQCGNPFLKADCHNAIWFISIYLFTLLTTVMSYFRSLHELTNVFYTNELPFCVNSTQNM